MKGVIVTCLAELVNEKFGKDKWENALEKSGLGRKSIFLVTQDVDDEIVLKVIDSVCKILNISLIQAADAFGVNDHLEVHQKVARKVHHFCSYLKTSFL